MDEIRHTILELFRQRENMRHIAEDEDFFDQGVSSLTIVELQIKVEEALKLTVPTSELMRLPTINAWIDAYLERSNGFSISATC